MAGVAVTGLALKGPEADHDGAALSPARVPAALRYFWADGFFAAAHDTFLVGYLSILAAALGASATQIGLISGIQSVGAILGLIPGAWVASRARSRRWVVVLYSGIVARLLLLGVAAAVAWTAGSTAISLLALLVASRAFFANLTLPAWTSLAADIVPERLRPRYFASRNFAMSVATLTFTPLTGLLLDGFGMPRGYVAAACLCFALGLVSTFAYARIPEPPRTTTATRVAWPPIREMVSHGRFRTFLVATVSLHFATMIAGPFFNVHLKQNLGASNFTVGWLGSVSAMSGLAAPLVIGVLMGDRGALWTSRLSLLVLPTLPLMWIGITDPWMVIVPNAAGGFFWAAFNLSNFQLLLESTPAESREHYVAAFHTSVFVALLLAPLIGGVIIDTLGYRPAFVVSGCGRVVATILFFVAIREGRSRTGGPGPRGAQGIAGRTVPL